MLRARSLRQALLVIGDMGSRREARGLQISLLI